MLTHQRTSVTGNTPGHVLPAAGERREGKRARKAVNTGFSRKSRVRPISYFFFMTEQ